MIWNNGQLHEGWTIKSLLSKHSSQPYNPDIANVFFRAGLIEAWGRGIERIYEACKQHNIPVPVITNEKAGLWFVFEFVKKSEKTTQKTTQKILDILCKNPNVSRVQLAEMLGNITEDGVKYQLNKLKKQGVIRRIGSDRGGHWELNENNT